MKVKDIIITILFTVFCTAVFCFVIFKGCLANREKRAVWEKEANAYYSKYKIELKGVIVDKVKIDSRYSTYSIKVIDSNVDKHDVREYHENYYLVIFGDSAKMVDGNYIGQINDSINIDYPSHHKIIWNEKERVEYELGVFSPDYCWLRKQGLGW
jgi:hypothetical protein